MLRLKEKLHINMDNKRITKLFCRIDQNLLLKKTIQIKGHDNEFTFEQGTKFKVVSIVGYGFDLLPIDLDEDYQIRIMYSEMDNYFEIL